MDISSNDSSFFPFFSNQLAGHGWLALLASLSRSSLNRKLAWLARSTRHARVAGRLCLFFSSLFLSLTRLLVFLSITHFARSLGVARFVLGFSRLAGSPACLVWLALFLASFAYSLGWLHLVWLPRQLVWSARFVLGFFGLAGSPACLVWLVLFLASFADSLVRSLGLAGSPASLVWLALFLASLAYSLGWLHLAWLARQLAWYGSLCSWLLSQTRLAGFTWFGWLASLLGMARFVLAVSRLLAWLPRSLGLARFVRFAILDFLFELSTRLRNKLASA